MTELDITIPTNAPVLSAIRRMPQIIAGAQRVILKQLGDDYVATLKRETPRGHGEANGARLVDSYETTESYGGSESRYRIRNTASQLAFVIKGRGPVIATRAKALRFVIDGQVYFRKRVGPVAPNDFPSRVDSEMRPRIAAAGQQLADAITREVT